MKGIKSYAIAFAALIASALGFSACQDHFDDPDLNKVPVATMKANATIAEIKELMWQDKDNYCEQVPAREDGSHYIISGRVVSSDYAGNCFKYIVLQDETGALTFSVNSYNLYLKYRRGQEVVVDLTGLHCGKYRGLFQVGFPSYNSSIPGYETSFMAPERFYSSSELNDLPKFNQIDTIQVASFSELGVTPSELRRWQSQLVRFNNVTWVENSTLETLSTYHSSGETQQIRDSEGNTLDVRTSGYSNFWNTKMPTEACDVVAIVGYYMNLAGSGGWQLTLIDINSILNVGHPSVPKGNRVNPYSVAEAAAYAANGSNVSGWVEGYIVGTVGPEVETIASDNDIEWSATPTLGNTLVIGQTADTKTLAQALVIALPQGSDLRTMGALRENPDNYGRHILIRGTFASVMGANGITNNSGSTSEFEIEGKEAPEPLPGNGTLEAPFSATEAIAYIDAGVGLDNEVYVKGTVTSITEIDTSTYGNATYIITDGKSNLTIYRGYYFNGNKFTSTDQLAVGQEVVVLGKLTLFYSTYEMTTGSKIISIDGEGPGTDDPTPTPDPSDDTKGQFNTFNDGTPKATYGTYTNATGWVATNCNILSGVAAGGTEQNPRFAFIGNEKTLAPTLNGKVSAPGTLESPTLTGGINTLKFNYGFAYSDTKCSITIQVLQNGSVVKEKTLELTSFTTKTAYEYSLAVNITGDFQIRIVNNSLSAADANKDRISIWNLTWD